MIAFDSNILIYAAAIVRTDKDVPKASDSRRLLGLLATEELVVAAPAFGEFVNVARKAGRAAEIIRRDLQRFRDAMSYLPVGEAAFDAGIDLAFRHRLQTWDAIIVATSAIKVTSPRFPPPARM